MLKNFCNIVAKPHVWSPMSSILCSRNFSSKTESRAIVTVVPGDGVGPELVKSVREVFTQMQIPVVLEEHALSEIHPETSEPFDTVLQSFRTNGIGLKGIIQNPNPLLSKSRALETLNHRFKRELDLFAQVVHVKSIEGVKSRHRNVDFIVVREQTEGEYSALEHESVPGVIESLKIITRKNATRIAKFAFDYARRHGRKKVTCIHKANIMKLTDGLFLQCCREVADLNRDITFNAMIVDNCCMQLVSNPWQFDVMVMPNLYGSVVSNVASGLIGGAGVVAGENYGYGVAVFEPGARHTFHRGKGLDVANPTAMLLASCNMLDYLNMSNHAGRLRRALLGVIYDDSGAKTADLGGQGSTSAFTRAVLDRLRHSH